MRKLLLFLCLLLTASPVFAATSYQNRANADFAIGVNPLLPAAPRIYPGGVYSWYPNPNWEIGIESIGYAVDINEPEVQGHFTYRNGGIFARYYLGNSLNILFGINERTYTGNTTIYSGAEWMRADFKVSVAVPVIAISNQWAYDSGFVLGIDWILVQPKEESQFRATTTNDSYSPGISGNQILEALMKGVFTGAVNTLNQLSTIENGKVNIYIGYAF